MFAFLFRFWGRKTHRLMSHCIRCQVRWSVPFRSFTGPLCFHLTCWCTSNCCNSALWGGCSCDKLIGSKDVQQQGGCRCKVLHELTDGAWNLWLRWSGVFNGAVTSPHHPCILILVVYFLFGQESSNRCEIKHGKYIKQLTRCWQMGLVVIQHDHNLRLYGHDLVPCAHGCHGTLPCLRWSCLPGSTWRCSFSGTTHLALLNELYLVGTFRALARMLGHICCKLCPLHLYADTDAPKKKWEHGSTTSVSLFSAMTQFQTLNLPWAFDLEPNAVESPDFKLITACPRFIAIGTCWRPVNGIVTSMLWHGLLLVALSTWAILLRTLAEIYDICMLWTIWTSWLSHLGPFKTYFTFYMVVC